MGWRAPRRRKGAQRLLIDPFVLRTGPGRPDGNGAVSAIGAGRATSHRSGNSEHVTTPVHTLRCLRSLGFNPAVRSEQPTSQKADSTGERRARNSAPAALERAPILRRHTSRQPFGKPRTDTASASSFQPHVRLPVRWCPALPRGREPEVSATNAALMQAPTGVPYFPIHESGARQPAFGHSTPDGDSRNRPGANGVLFRGPAKLH